MAPGIAAQDGTWFLLMITANIQGVELEFILHIGYKNTSWLILGLGNMLSLGMEPFVRIRSVLDNVELSVLIIVAVSTMTKICSILSQEKILLPSMNHPICVSLFIPKLSVVPRNDTLKCQMLLSINSSCNFAALIEMTNVICEVII